MLELVVSDDISEKGDLSSWEMTESIRTAGKRELHLLKAARESGDITELYWRAVALLEKAQGLEQSSIALSKPARRSSLPGRVTGEQLPLRS